MSCFVLKVVVHFFKIEKNMFSKIPPEGSLVVDDSVSFFSSEFAAILHHVLITPNRVRITLKSQLFYFTRDFEFALKAQNKLH